MKYKFPEIYDLNDVVPYLPKDGPFYVADKGDYFVINYTHSDNNTFPDIDFTDEDSLYRTSILRECRGIIFDKWTKKIIRRPYHKFFNVEQKVEVFLDNVDLSQPHIILEKLDGSMIAPFEVSHKGSTPFPYIIWGTKMGDTDVATPVNQFVFNNPQYQEFARNMINNGVTPIFEWMSRQNRIVLDYGQEDKLTLVAVRDMRTGVYFSYSNIQYWGEVWGIPTVKVHKVKGTNPKELQAAVASLGDEEGIVIAFEDGHKIKMKSEWYCRIHKTKEALTFEKDVVDLWINGQIDDIFQFMLDTDKERVNNFIDFVIDSARFFVLDVLSNLDEIRGNKMTRKEFALEHGNKFFPMQRQLIFKFFDKEYNFHLIWNEFSDMVKMKTKNTTNYNEMKKQVWPNAEY